MNQQPHEMARTFMDEVWGKGKTELVAQMTRDDVVFHDPLAGDLDRKGYEQQVQMMRRAFPDLTMEVLDQISTGDKVVTRFRATGTQKGELMGIPASNRKGTVEGITIGRFVGGKLAESHSQWDVLGMLKNIGVAPPIGAPGARPEAPRAGAPARAPHR